MTDAGESVTPAEEKVVGLMAALEQSVKDAKAERQGSEDACCHRSGSNPNDAEWNWRAGGETTCADCLQRVRLVALNSRARKRTAHYLAEHSGSSDGEATRG